MKAKISKAKVSAKPKAKPASKPAKAKAKAAPESAPKPAKVRATPKPAAKSAKAPVKSALKKPGAKSAQTTKKVKLPAKGATVRRPLPTAAASKVARKPDTAKAPKRSGKASVKPSVKKPGPAGTGKPASAAKKHDSPVSKPAKGSMTGTAVAAPFKAAPKSPVTPPAPKPVRLSRLQQLTVPSMPQSIASTAAKSSYSQLPDRIVPVAPVYVAAKKDSKLAHNWKRKALDQLTDADVSAMPDSEYMNAVQTAFFRSKLVKLKNDMLDNAGETTEHLREETVIVPDPADRATIEEEHALELRTRDRERKLLKKIAQSIVRIDAGDYGYCDETGEPIGVARLLARPTATLSLEAQQRRELKQKMFGD